jgi:predicted AlkP superfamily pyrophosphatase or phosphodiesterase
MKSLLALILAAVSLLAAERPKLVLAIAVDQFRYDYLLRFRGDYKEGLDRLLTRGAVFTNAYYEHFPTVTAVGHSTFLTGALPSVSGIVGNEWYDRGTSKTVTSVSDDTVKILAGTGDGGASPNRLLVSTVGDELKMSNGSQSRVIGVSIKDRSAILPAGHMADGAFWFDSKNGNFVSSTYYFAELPGWASAFNREHPADRYKGATWMNVKMPDEAGANLYDAELDTPFANELIEQFAEHAVEGEKLGQRGVTDLLAISFSANDHVGHRVGPDAPEVHDISVRTDQVIGKIFRFLDSHVGMQDVLVVLTADHGVAPVPEVNQARHMPGGRERQGIVKDAVQTTLARKYGEGKWVSSSAEDVLYLNLTLIREKNLDRAEVNQAAADAALTMPHVFRAYTREQLMRGAVDDDLAGSRVRNGFHVQRGADVFVVLDPYWMFSPRGTTHGTVFSYDTHVPVIFMGSGIQAGRFDETITPNDIAPSLATLLGVETPSGSSGRALAEMFTTSSPSSPNSARSRNRSPNSYRGAIH